MTPGDDNAPVPDGGPRSTGTWVCTLPVRTSSAQDKILRSRFEAGRQVYNAALGEAIRRLQAGRETDLYTRAKAAQGKERRDLFRGAWREARFTENDLGSYGLRLRTQRCDCPKRRGFPPRVCPSCGHEAKRTWIADHLGPFTVKELGERAYRTAERMLFGGARTVRFLRAGGVTAIDGHGDVHGTKELHFRDGHVVWAVTGSPDLALSVVVDPDDAVVSHALASRLKYVRLVRRSIGGRERWFAQLVVAGLPYRKPHHAVTEAKVAAVVGIASVGVVSNAGVRLTEFCAEIGSIDAEVRRLQRKLERQRRMTNPNNYEPNGRCKPRDDRSPWVVSTRYLDTLRRLRELERRQAEHRKTLQGQLANEILALGNDIVIRAPSYRKLAHRYGRGIRRRAPGTFVALLERKATAAGGVVERLPEPEEPMSDPCHHCGSVVAKTPRELRRPWRSRVHRCTCGVELQLDLYRAFLAWCTSDGTLDRTLAADRWSAWEAALRAAWSGGPTAL